MASLNMNPNESLQLDIATKTHCQFWTEGDEDSEDFSLLNAINEDKRLSDLILKKLVSERRKK